MRGYLICLLLVSCYAIANCAQNNRVRLTDVQVLTLQKGKYTNGKRSSPIQQLTCSGNKKYCQSYAPSVVQCYNRGSDGSDVNWECKADMDKSVKFGALTVSCEGYDYSDDPFILAGSCGLEYSLVAHDDSNSNKKSDSEYTSSGFFTILTIVVIVLILLYVSSTAKPSVPNQQEPPRASAPPPPPGFRSEYSTGYDNSYSSSNNTYSQKPADESNKWTSFMTGAAMGGAASYLLTRRNQNSNACDSDWPSSTRETDSSRKSSPKSSHESSGFATTSRR